MSKSGDMIEIPADGSKGPLSDIRVLDLTTVLMGPFATQMLGDMGADVIKVEAPAGDSLRWTGPCRNEGMGALFLQANRNKRSIQLDLKKSEDHATLLSLIETADVLVYNIRPQAMARLGLGFSEVKAIRPDIIYCGAVGYGAGSPDAGKAVYDDLMQASSGIVHAFEATDGTPRYVPINICDRIVGLHVAQAILAAIVHRLRTGEGQEIEVPMMETMTQFVFADHSAGHAFVPAMGPMGYKRILSNTRGPYRTKDGYISVTVYTNRHWTALSEILGIEDITKTDPVFATQQSRTENSLAVGRFLSEIFPERTAREWLKALQEADIPAALVNTFETLLVDHNVTSVNLFQELDHPSEGRVRVTKPPVRFSKSPATIRRLAPKLNEHSDEIRAELAAAAISKSNTSENSQ